MSRFRFKEFDILQDKTAMKVGTDGVLLGAWTDCAAAKQILDIGTGTGLIALMLAQRNQHARIDAIEIEEDAYEQALLNISNSKFIEQLQVYHASLAEWIRFTDHKYDLIVCNPPYFENGFRVEDVKRKQARDAAHLPADQVIDAFKKKTETDGLLSLILPVKEAEEFIDKALSNDIYCRRKTIVYSKAAKPPIRYLIDLVKHPSDSLTDDLIIEEAQHQVYTDAYKQLTKDFYLNF